MRANQPQLDAMGERILEAYDKEFPDGDIHYVHQVMPIIKRIVGEELDRKDKAYAEAMDKVKNGLTEIRDQLRRNNEIARLADTDWPPGT